VKCFVLSINFSVIVNVVIKLDFKLIVFGSVIGSSFVSVLNSCCKLCKPKMIHTQLLLVNETFRRLKHLAASLDRCLMSILSKH
jgi:hypothetical protein